MTKDGKVGAAVIGAGGYFGVDKKGVALAINSLNFTYDSDNYVKNHDKRDQGQPQGRAGLRLPEEVVIHRGRTSKPERS